MSERDTKVPQARRLRADARHNRERILAAATEAFRDSGVDVQMSDVARLSGVAIGTVYRHFPTKEALVDALLVERLTTAGQQAREAAAAEADPWDALEAFLRVLATRQVADRSMAEFIGGRIPGSAELRQLLHEVFETFSRLVEDAQHSGQLRADVDATDIRMAVICVARAVWADWPDPEWVLRRYLSVVLDGLRAPGHTALTGSASSKDFDPGDRQPRSAKPFSRGRRGW